MKALLEPRRVFVGIVAIGLLALCLRPMSDPDVWWHLRTGQLILQNHYVFHQDPYSFTFAGRPWINHEWLFDVLLYSLFRISGPGGLIVALTIVTATAFFLAYVRSPGRPYIAGVVTVWAAMASIPAFGVRPQMLSLLLAAVLLKILDESRERVETLWWAVPLTLLWVNLHAEYALGLALIFLALVGEMIDGVLDAAASRTGRPRIRALALVLLCCLAVVPLNPYGPRMYWYPLRTLTSQSMHSYIQEWFSPNFHQADYIPALLFILAIVLSAAISVRRLRGSELLFLAATMVAALRSVRHVPIFLLVAIPILSGLVQEMPHPLFARLRGNATAVSNSRKRVMNAIILLACGAFCAVRFQSILALQARTEATSFPRAATEWIEAHHPPAPMLNHYNWGGYFIWKLYPQYRVFIDGRADVYGDSFMNDVASAYHVSDGWRPIFDSWHVKTVFLPTDAPLITLLISQPGWKMAYRDDQAVVLIRTQ